MKSHGDRMILMITLALLATGLIMVYSSSHVYALEKFHNSSFFLKKSLFSITAGLLVFFFFSRFSYQRLRTLSFPLMIISIILLTLLLTVPSLCPRIGGSVRWIRLPGLPQYQPSELSKIAVVIFLSAVFSKKKLTSSDCFVSILCVIVTFLLVVRQPDFSTAFLIGTLSMILVFFNGISYSYMIGSIMLMSVVSFQYIRNAPYRWKRMMAFLDPWQDPYGSGYHIIHSLIAIGSGGLTGAGLGNSHQKFNYLPEPFTDFIFSIICEELGFAGSCALLLLYALLFYRILAIAVTVKDKFGFLLLIGSVSLLFLQVLINIGVTVKLFPTTGVTLPFISFGGSSLVTNMMVLGIIYNISRESGLKS